MEFKMSKIVVLLLVFSVLFAACAPQSGNGGSQSGSSVGTQVAPQAAPAAQPAAQPASSQSAAQQAAPQAVEVPEAQDYAVPVTPTADFRSSNSETSAVLDNCSAAYAWGEEYAVKTCGGFDVQHLFQAGTLFGIGSVAYATNITAISNSGLQTAGLVYSVSTAEVVGFIVVAAEAAAPVAIGVGLIALPIMSLAEITTQPDPASSPLVKNWIQNRQAPAAVSTQYETEQTVEAVQVSSQTATQPVVQQMGPVFDWVDLSSIPVVADEQTFPADLGTVLKSTKHPESSLLITSAINRAGGKYLNSTHPNGCRREDMSNGAICLYAIVDPGVAAPTATCPDCIVGNIAAQVVVTKYVYFLMVGGSVRTSPPSGGESGWLRLGQTQYYMEESSMFWHCAWWMSQRVANGHGMVPEQYWLDAGSGWDTWHQKMAERGLPNWPIAQVTLPSWNG